MTCEPAQLDLIPFPYSDLQSSKKRPVLVLTPPDRHGDFIALAIISSQPRNHAFEIDPAALAVGALPKRGWVRVDKIFTLSQGSVTKSFGAVTPAFLEGVLDGLCRRIGYARP